MLAIWALITVPLFVLCAKRGTLKSKAEWGVFLSLGISVVLLGLILWGIIPQVVNLAGKFDLAFVNGLHLPFNSGTIFFFLLIAALIAWGIWYGYRKNKQVLLLGTFCFTMLLVGYSTFFTLVIRSNANPTIDENNPEDAVALLAYLNREQYGSNPLFHGQTYNTRVIGAKDGNPVYVKDMVNKRYVVSNDRKEDQPIYDPAGCMVYAGTMTSSPGPIPNQRRMSSRPAEAELTFSTRRIPQYWAIFCSKALVRGPVVIHPERRAATTSSIIASSIWGGEKGIMCIVFCC